MPMQLWKHPSNYMGETWYDYYVFLGRSRDSDELEESNFQVGLERLGGEYWDDDEDNIPGENFTQVGIIRESHWAVGWVEWIAIHRDTRDVYTSPRSKGKIIYTTIIDQANEMCNYLENYYGALDEQHYSQLEYDNLIGYLSSEFNGTIEERFQQVEQYLDNLSDSRQMNCNDIDWKLVEEIKEEWEEKE